MERVELSLFEHKDLTTSMMPASMPDALLIAVTEEAKAIVFELDPGAVVEEHDHVEIRIVFIRHGATAYTVANETSTMCAGDALTIQPGVPHSLAVIGDTPLRLMEIAIPVSHAAQP
jgi:unsaturated pyranuronate lyase